MDPKLAAHFPESFQPDNWMGFRAKELSNRAENVFQQVVCDAFKGIFFDKANIFATAGKDGSIDAFITAAPVVNNPRFGGFSFPFIVECKHHDDGKTGIKKKLTKGGTM